jgi:putative colanic acid biosynthesis acetyltransferase WcaF
MGQNLANFTLPPTFRSRSAFYVQLWWLVQSTLFSKSPQFLYQWRSFLLRLFGANVGHDVHIRPSAKFTYPWKVSIGAFSWIGDDVVFYSLGNISVGKNTVISQKSYLCAASHRHDRTNFDIFADPISIGDGVWIASDVFVAPGVHIDDDCVIGARSSVFSNIPAGMIAYGYPAQPKKKRVFVD